MTIELGTFMSNLTTSAQGVFDSMLPVIYLLGGIFLALYLVSYVINLIRGAQPEIEQERRGGYPGYADDNHE